MVPESQPALWRLARLSYDAVRQRRVLLYPEGVLLLNDTGAAILDLCDGRRTVADIASTLATRYETSNLLDDVAQYLDALHHRDLIHDAR